MDSFGEKAVQIPIADNCSPVLSQKPIFFGKDPLAPVTDVPEESIPHHSNREIKDEFKLEVEKRKQQGFIGNEYTVKEAMTKQFGTERIEARAFLEYYWEMKAKCLEAVEKRRNSEVEAFQNHPLFSPNWLVPTSRDIRWHLKNEIKNEENEIVNEVKLNQTKHPNQVKQRKEVVKEKLSSISYQRYPLTRDLSSLKNNDSRKGIPLRKNRDPVVKQIPSAISSERFLAKRSHGESKMKHAESRKGYKMSFAEIRKIK